jgi:hypothetical protein
MIGPYPLPLPCKPVNWNELFSWWDCQFCLAPGFSKAVQCLTFPIEAAELLYPHMGLFQLCVLPFPPRQRGNISSVYLATSFVQRGCTRIPSCARVWGSLPNSVLHSPGRLAECLGWKQICYRAAQAGVRQVLCLHVFGESQSSQMLAVLFLCFSVLHYCWQGCRHTTAERGSEVCIGRLQ